MEKFTFIKAPRAIVGHKACSGPARRACAARHTMLCLMAKQITPGIAAFTLQPEGSTKMMLMSVSQGASSSVASVSCIAVQEEDFLCSATVQTKTKQQREQPSLTAKIKTFAGGSDSGKIGQASQLQRMLDTGNSIITKFVI